MKLLPVLALAALFVGGARAEDPTAAPAAKPAPYRVNVNYQPVFPAQPTSVPPGQIEVLDFFWYGCPHCNALEPYIESWERSKPANVVLKRVPAIQPEWEPAARAYYVSEVLGLTAKSHPAIFNAIHTTHELPQMADESDFERFFVQKFGVNGKQFEAAWNSPQVEADLAQAQVLQERYSIMQYGVPMLIVNGRWITGAGMVPGYSQIMQVVDYLVQQEQAALPASVK